MPVTIWKTNIFLFSFRLVSSIHGALATTAGLVIVRSCRDTMTDT